MTPHERIQSMAHRLDKRIKQKGLEGPWDDMIHWMNIPWSDDPEISHAQAHAVDALQSYMERWACSGAPVMKVLSQVKEGTWGREVGTCRALALAGRWEECIQAKRMGFAFDQTVCLTMMRHSKLSPQRIEEGMSQLIPEIDTTQAFTATRKNDYRWENAKDLLNM